jgi:sialate O-acetylesterase
MNKLAVLLAGISMLISSFTKGEIRLPKILGNNMVLQQKKAVTVWGWANPGEQVTINFSNQIKKTVTDPSGSWKVILDPMTASEVCREMKITGMNTIILHNILIGEVWLCSGQSNMEYSMRKNSKIVKLDSSKDSPIDELDRAKNPMIRIFLVTSKNLQIPDIRHSGWSIAKDSALRSFSAAGYFFAKELYSKLHVPIGVISSAVPGSAIEPWLPGNVKADTSSPGKFYPTMIKPLAPFAIKGILWYQGETNCFQNETIEYTHKMEILILGWRKLWQEELPFYYVQISPFYYSKSKGKYPLDEETLPKFWEAQTLAMKIPKTGMAVINDLAKSPDDLHPDGKWEVGRRLAQWPLALDYEMKVTPSGPIYRVMKIEGNKVVLSFDYVGSGLISKDGKPLTWFMIAGEDGKFVPADVEITGRKLVVSSAAVTHPVNVRFAWSEAAQPNFFNKDGLPAVPFRTDNPLRF